MRKSTELVAWMGHRIGKPPGWERVVRLFVPPEKCADLPDICTIRDGVVFLAQPAVLLGWNVAFFGTYEPELRKIVETVLKPGGVAIDVGANVGWHTLLMARLVGDSGRVLAIEPNPSVRQRLIGNIGLNRFRHVEVVACAAAEAEGRIEFHAPPAGRADSGTGFASRDGAGPSADTISVETRSLDNILSAMPSARLDLIKIDVEGFEWPVLRGGEDSISHFHPHIVFEYDAAYVARGGGEAATFMEFFRRHRYRLFAVGRTGAAAIETSDWPNSANIWAIPMGDA